MASAIVIILTLILVESAQAESIEPFHNRNSNLSSSRVAGYAPRIRLPSCTLGPGRESHRVVNDSNDEIWPYQVYRSSPFNPPELKITRNGRPLAPGLLFISPENFGSVEAAKDLAPLIMTDAGQLVWNGPKVNATNFRVASYKGNPVLIYWTGSSTSGANIGHGYGSITFLNGSYDQILTVCPQLDLVTPENVKYPCDADLHEAFVTSRGTLLVTAYNATQADLSSIGGPKNGWIFDSLFFELDLSGKVLFRWSAIEHVPVSQSKYPLRETGRNQSVPFDFFHINSVVSIGEDYYLVNSRHLWTAHLVSTTGDIVWTLQGDTGGDFGSVPAKGKFSWQHYALPDRIDKISFTITFFNNGAAFSIDNGTSPSNGLKLKLLLPPNKSIQPIVLEYLSDPAETISAGSQGSRSTLPNGNVLIGYGQIAVLKEFGPLDPSGGDIRWTARFGTNSLVQNYRGFKTEWHGKPTTKPDLAVIYNHTGAGCNTGFVSWNGATDVESWAVSEGLKPGQLSYVGNVGYLGFETEFTVARPCVQVTAIVNGAQSAKSNVVCTHS